MGVLLTTGAGADDGSSNITRMIAATATIAIMMIKSIIGNFFLCFGSCAVCDPSAFGEGDFVGALAAEGAVFGGGV
jgi:hypothetical protein